MNTNKQHKGFAIALAWPETYCKQPGGWYDPIMLFLKINKNNFYKVGHAAVVLVDIENRKFHYFDFGRYHAPFGHGRVRSGETDDDLIIHSTPEFTKDQPTITNFDVLLTELQNNESCHGEGALWASYIPVDFNAAFQKAKQMQEQSPLPYGPFIQNGTNCSRFVNTIIRAGKPALQYKLWLKYKIPLTPTPLSNVKALSNKLIMPKLLKTAPFVPEKKLSDKQLNSTLPAPKRHPDIPPHAQWLSGEGAGSWFVINPLHNGFEVHRFAPSGKKECSSFYEGNNYKKLFSKRSGYAIAHPGNCRKITIKTGNLRVSFQ